MAYKKDKSEKVYLFDPQLLPKDYSANKKVAKKALDHAVGTFDRYKKMRMYTRGGEQVNCVHEWGKRYRAYKCIFQSADHSYVGQAQTFMPVLRKSVNIVESEAVNALFSREDYFSVDAVGDSTENEEMARRAYGVIKYFSDKGDFNGEFEMALKQALIYEATAIENVLIKERVEGLFRKKDITPVIDPEFNEPILNPETGQPMTRVEFNIYKIEKMFRSARIEARDIYRVYVDHRFTNPEDGDIVYRDSMSAQELLEYAEDGVYSSEAVKKMIGGPGTFDSGLDMLESDDTTYVSDMRDDKNLNARPYEVLRFQGLFTCEDETTGQKIRKQFWIDIGERKHVLRCIQNPIIGGWKTFSFCNYDTMLGEFYSDSVLSPYLKLQYAINDKENQSLDALTFNLDAPWVSVIGLGPSKDEILQARKKRQMIFMVKGKDGLQKIQTEVPLNHLNSEQIRLVSFIDQGTGATSLAGGAPTGTQVDRSGKSLGLLMSQTRSQFSKFVKKFERSMIQTSLQKTLDLIVQFFDDEVEIALSDDKGGKTLAMQSPAELTGRFCVTVSAGSEYLKERERRDSLLEFISILGTDDTFRQMVDKPKLLRSIARTMPGNMEQYIDEENMVNKMYQQIQQLQQTIEAQQVQMAGAMSEVSRLSGVVKQTDKANQANPSMADNIKTQNQVKAQVQGG